jgi:hypothetical protein
MFFLLALSEVPLILCTRLLRRPYSTYFLCGTFGAPLILRFAAALALRLLVLCSGLSAPCTVVIWLVSVLYMSSFAPIVNVY